MKGSTLKSLVAVADLARLDLEAAAIMIRSRAGTLRVGYAGAYAAGYRNAEVSDVDDFSVSVSANRFKILAGMFADEESVVLKRTATGLSIRSRSSHVNLVEWGQFGRFPTVDRDKLDFSARLPASSLIAEIDAASDFVAESYIKQSLTGVRLDFLPSALVVTAFDGFGALFQSTVKAKLSGTGSVVVPKDDFLIGAKLMGEGDVIIARPTGIGAVVIASADALFRSSVFATDWPDITPITEKADFAGRFQIDSGQIRNLIAGAKALDTGLDINVAQIGKKIVFSAESEGGTFTTSTRGSIPAPIKYDRDTLAKVVKLGPVLEFNVPAKANDPTRVESDHRRCWIVTRI